MTGVALALVVLAACVHASWNLVAKRADDKLAFLWCSALVSVAVFLPLGAWLVATQPVPPLGWGILVLSALLEAAYYWSLAQAYRYGDLSQVYPIARGTAPLLVPLLAAVFLGERPSLVELGGILVVVSGVAVLLAPATPAGHWQLVAGHPSSSGVGGDGSGMSANRVECVSTPSSAVGWVRGASGVRSASGVSVVRAARRAMRGVPGRGTLYALLTGAIIAAYTTLDKRGVALVPPWLYAYVLFVGLTLALVPLVLLRRAAVRTEWRRRRAAIVAVGVLAPVAYGLVLLALTITPVGSVAAAREVSVVIAAVLGALVLHEPYGGRRVVGSAWIAFGLVLLVLG